MMMTKNYDSDAAPHVLTAYKGAPFEKNFKIKFLQYWKACSCAILFAVLVSGTPLLIVVKYASSKPGLIKMKSSHRNINFG